MFAFLFWFNRVIGQIQDNDGDGMINNIVSLGFGVLKDYRVYITVAVGLNAAFELIVLLVTGCHSLSKRDTATAVTKPRRARPLSPSAFA